jgi:hypothetical protein
MKSRRRLRWFRWGINAMRDLKPSWPVPSGFIVESAAKDEACVALSVRFDREGGCHVQSAPRFPAVSMYGCGLIRFKLTDKTLANLQIAAECDRLRRLRRGRKADLRRPLAFGRGLR